MKDLNIVFMGTPQFAVHGLKAIVEAGYKVAGVVTAPDRPAGRGRKLQQSDVKKYALEHKLPVLQPTNLKSEEFLAQLKELNPNLQVVVAFRMLPAVVWKLPEYGTFNLHASLLPQYRGAAPINWAIINGETSTGVSTFFIDDKIDTGEMILQKPIEIGSEENAGALHDKLMHAGAELILDTLEEIRRGQLKTKPQKDHNGLRNAHKLHKDNTRINLDWSVDRIFNFIRGLSPYPAAWTMLLNGDQKLLLKVFLADKQRHEHSFAFGEIIQEGKEVKIAVKGGFLILREVQLPGKRKMPVKDLLNGFNFKENAKVL